MKKLFFNVLIYLLFSCSIKSQVIYKPIEILARDSYDIVEGKVINVAPEWDAEKRFISSFITIKVVKSFKKKIKDKRIVLKELGGTIGKYSTISELDPVYKIGESVVVFVDFDVGQNKYFTAGLWQGKFIIKDNSKDKILLRNTNRGMIILNKEPKVKSKLSYEDLLKLIKEELP